MKKMVGLILNPYKKNNNNNIARANKNPTWFCYKKEILKNKVITRDYTQN